MEDEVHLFAVFPRLAAFWDRALPGQLHPTTVAEAVIAICAAAAGMPLRAAHTAAIGALWTLWKARNAMVFNNELQDALAIARRMQDHIVLWTCCAPVGSTLSLLSFGVKQ